MIPLHPSPLPGWVWDLFLTALMRCQRLTLKPSSRACHTIDGQGGSCRAQPRARRAYAPDGYVDNLPAIGSSGEAGRPGATLQAV
ncbi:MAG: hypothetical protein JRJ38_01290 [Deltaproteobacteria bacterium]|nr:hypothetical protein [Deltaproteobacteria bacterium]